MWVSFHHERLDGNGYPFHHDERDLPLGSRVVAVADTFTAICEDRPYRQATTKDRALRILRDMAASSVLDPYVVSKIELHFNEINSSRLEAQIMAH